MPSQSKRRARRRRRTQAREADKYALYQEAVQDPAYDVGFASRVFRRRFGRVPRLLREDFSGAAAFACKWVASHPENRAWGIDLDPEPLAWGKEHNLSRLKPDQQRRVELVQGDVLEVPQQPKVDVTVAFNFSYFLFQRRAELLAYFRQAHSTLRSQGIFMLDAYGGPDAQRTLSETREYDGFDYVWDQDLFDPISHRAVNHIHFEFPDGSELRKAFSYDWRLWSIPELRDLLADAGFRESEVYWESMDRKTGEGTGSYYRAQKAADDPAWVAYIVGIR
jgi:hypothetical protein